MAQVALPWATTFTVAVPRLLGSVRVLMPLPLIAGCASCHTGWPVPPEVTQSGVAARVLIPPDLIVDSPETVVKPGTPGQASADTAASPALGVEPTTFALPDAIAFALRHNPRLRSARAAVERARGQEQVAFAPFLPQIDLLGQYGVTSSNLGPGSPGYAGFLRAVNDETHSYQETEVALQWTLYDFGRTGGRYRQVVERERINELQLVRPARRSSSTWPPLTWTSCWPALPGGCKRTPSAEPGRSWTTRRPGAKAASH
jgi:hypothetical protein